jgi:hypothetical protein
MWTLAFAAAFAPILAVQRALSYAHTDEELTRFRAPLVPEAGSALVFVHGSWGERIAARLQGDGMRLDSLETALRRNDTCDVQGYVTARIEQGAPSLPPLDFEPLPGSPPNLAPVWLSPGNRVRLDPRREPSLRCRREAIADRNGVVALAPLSWQGDLPGALRGRALFVRDLGPQDNQRVIARYPDRQPLFYFTPDTMSAPSLRPYAEGLARIWGVESSEDGPDPERE